MELLDVSQVRNIAIALPSTGLEEWESTRGCYESGWLTQGPQVAAFEKQFAKYHNVSNAIATTSCTTGLHLALAALGIGPGDEVIVPAFTWVATANVVLYCGATPIFIDIDPQTYNLDVEQLSDRITERTKAVIPVHLFGLCADIDTIRQVLPKHIAIIEDAACAAGALYKGKMAGGLGLAGVFSFHPRKSITTGEGGMVTTNDETFAELTRKLRNHGASVSEEERHHGPKPYILPEFNLLGFNYRMTDIQGAIGLTQLAKLEHFINERQKWAEYYCSELSEIEWIRTPSIPQNGQHAWQAFVCYVDPLLAPMERNDIMEILQKHGISTRPGTHAVHMLSYYRERFSFKPYDYPNARDCDLQTIALPLHNRMNEADYEYVIAKLKNIG